MEPPPLVETQEQKIAKEAKQEPNYFTTIPVIEVLSAGSPEVVGGYNYDGLCNGWPRYKH